MRGTGAAFYELTPATTNRRRTFLSGPLSTLCADAELP